MTHPTVLTVSRPYRAVPRPARRRTPKVPPSMTGNATTRFDNVSLLSVAGRIPARVTSSTELEEQLGTALSRLRLPRRLLERVAGVTERRNWSDAENCVDATIEAGESALRQAGVSARQVGLLINTSVTRMQLEPSVAVGLHHGLGLPSSAVNFDVTNACLGFVNGMSLAAGMIQSGQIDYALVINGEDADEIQRNTIKRLQREEIGRADFMSEFASLTLGSGAAAAVLGRSDLHPEGHPLLGGITRAATEFHTLCVGSVEGMFTDAKALLSGGLDLVVSAWREAIQDWQWAGMDRYITHQVSRVHTDAIVKAVGLDRSKVPTTFPSLGNVGPASIPLTLAAEQSRLRKGDRVLLMGVGSGLNTGMLELAW